jgi:hypothetical protein
VGTKLTRANHRAAIRHPRITSGTAVHTEEGGLLPKRQQWQACRGYSGKASYIPQTHVPLALDPPGRQQPMHPNPQQAQQSVSVVQFIGPPLPAQSPPPPEELPPPEPEDEPPPEPEDEAPALAQTFPHVVIRQNIPPWQSLSLLQEHALG